MAARLILVALVVVGVGLVATGSLSVDVDTDNIPIVGDAIDSGNQTEKRLKTVNNSRYYSEDSITKVVLHQSGTAEIHLTEDHSCLNAIQISHTESEKVYKTVKAPEFSGPATVDLKRIVENNGPYPNPEFEIELTNNDRSTVCLASGDTLVTVVVPKNWTQ